MKHQPAICARETDVLDLIAIGQWPARAGADLTAHVATCPNCTDVALVAAAIVDVRDNGESFQRLPDAGIVWLRAQMRARQAAKRRAARPLWVAQLAGIAAVVAILAIWSGGLMGTVATLASAGWTAAGDLLTRQPALVSQPATGSGAQAVGSWLIPGLLAATVAVVLLAFGVSSLADGDPRPATGPHRRASADEIPPHR